MNKILLADKYLWSVAFSNDNKRLVASQSHAMRIWDIECNKIISNPWQGHDEEITAVAISQDGKYFISADAKYERNVKSKTTCLWEKFLDPVTNKPKRRYTFRSDSRTTAAAFSPNGKYAVIAELSGSVSLLHITKNKPIISKFLRKSGDKSILSLTFSYDSRYVACGDSRSTMYIWDVVTGKCTSTWWTNNKFEEFSSLAFSQNGKYLISGSSMCLYLYEIKTKNLIQKIWENNLSSTCVAFSKNNKFIVCGGKNHLLYLWDAVTCQLIHQLSGHNDTIQSVQFSSDSKYIISAGKDKALLLWEVKTGELVCNMWRGHEGSMDIVVALSSDGKHAVSGAKDGSIYLWEVTFQNWVEDARLIVNRNFSIAEWQRFIGDALPYQKTCPDLPSPGEEGWVEPYAGE